MKTPYTDEVKTVSPILTNYFSTLPIAYFFMCFSYNNL